MAMDEELTVDADGIPILTELVHEYEIDASTTQYADDDTDTPASIADRLLESKSFQRQIEQHQLAGKLEVAPLAADLRCNQGLGVLFRVSKIGRRPVACDQIHRFVKYRRTQARPKPQVRLERLRRAGG